MRLPSIYDNKSLINSWTYDNSEGEYLGATARYEDDIKKIVVPFFKPDGKDGFLIGIPFAVRPLFGLYQLAKHDKNRAVFITEGEKCAAAMQSLGLCAVTSLGGSNAAKQADWTPLNGFKMVYLLPDNDEAGEHYAQDVYSALAALSAPPAIRILRLPNLPSGGDVVDWIQAQVTGWNGAI